MNKTPPPTEKIQKVLARAGLGSRRTIEAWIKEGKIKVNRQLATLGDRVSIYDDIWVEGRKVQLSRLVKPQRKVICYNKRLGELCTRHDPEGRPTVFDKLPELAQGRWVNIGRLDINTTGLLLLTNDGELANRLTHPSYQIEREYLVRVRGEMTAEIIRKLRKGVELDDGMAKFEDIIPINNKEPLQEGESEPLNLWYRVILTEGRQREVRRLFESQGLLVSRLKRIRFGHAKLPRLLREGQFEDLDKVSLNALLQSVKISPAKEPKESIAEIMATKKEAEKKARKPTKRPIRREVRARKRKK